MWKKIKILIADDEPIILLYLKEMLEEAGYKVVGKAKDGLGLVKKTGELFPDLIITDIVMPNMDGLTALKIIKNIQELKNIPVILLSSHSQDDMIEQSIELGVFAYLVKPFVEADIRPTIEIAMNRWKEFTAIQKDIDDLKNELETRKFVEKAKGVLMDKYNMSESQAYKSIQRLSMDSRKSMKEISEAIFLANQIK